MDSIIVNRKNNHPDSYMKTISIIGYVNNNETYKITKNTLVKHVANSKSDDIKSNENLNVLKLKDTWNLNNIEDINNSNILGSNVLFEVNNRHINIPIINTTKENLKYFNAVLLKHNDYITINTPCQIPITTMDIGKTYVPEYLLKKGGGCYLEYHDTPHFHMPLNNNSSGYLILGKKVNDEIHLGAFNISYGYAIYTLPFVIHCDAYLVGEYLVLYTVTPNYSTALLRCKGEIVDVTIKK